MQPAAVTGELIDGRYRVGALLGRGSMADVFAADDELEGQSVALKVVRSKVAADSASLRRFRREAESQRRVLHQNVARVYGGGMTARRQPYLVFELLRGTSLRRELRERGALEITRAVSYAWQSLEGLAAAHRVGVIHRDLKPANLMLEPSVGPVDRVVLIDFGFAMLEGGSRLTGEGQVVGSLAYLAPERLLGEAGTAAADLYSVGVLLYEMLAGRRPFVGEDELALLHLHLEAPPPPLRDVRPSLQIPAALETAILRALAKHPAERAADAQSMAAELEAAMVGYMPPG